MSEGKVEIDVEALYKRIHTLEAEVEKQKKAVDRLKHRIEPSEAFNNVIQKLRLYSVLPIYTSSEVPFAQSIAGLTGDLGLDDASACFKIHNIEECPLSESTKKEIYEVFRGGMDVYPNGL